MAPALVSLLLPITVRLYSVIQLKSVNSAFLEDGNTESIAIQYQGHALSAQAKERVLRAPFEYVYNSCHDSMICTKYFGSRINFMERPW